MVRYYVKAINGKIIGRAEKLEDNDIQIISNHMIPCANYDIFNPEIMSIKKVDIINNEAVYTYNIVRAAKDMNKEFIDSKESKEIEIKNEFNFSLDRGFITSLNIKVNANFKDIVILDSLLKTTDSETIIFRDFNNEFISLSIEQITQILFEIRKNILLQQQKKWDLLEALKLCETIDTIKQIKWN
jgi:hypothetical protein